MAEPRTRFIQHRGKRIYLIDIEGLTPDQVIALVPAVARDVRAQPKASVVTLLNVRGVKLEPRMNEELKALAAGNKPYVKGSAIVGLNALQRVVLNMVKLFSRRDFQMFETLDEAKDYLVEIP